MLIYPDMINVHVERNGTENNMSLLKRFTKKVQGSGVLPKVRSLRYSLRKQSKRSNKVMAMMKLHRKDEVEMLMKMGKMPEKKAGYSR
jgi:ribosomal protein S21